MALYSEKVMDHFRNPRNVGVIADADGIGEAGNAKCGDIMKIYLKISDGVIKGKRIEDALALTNKAVTEALGGLPAHKLHCSVLAEEAVKAALLDYYRKNGLPYDEALLAPHACAFGEGETR